MAQAVASEKDASAEGGVVGKADDHDTDAEEDDGEEDVSEARRTRKASSRFFAVLAAEVKCQ